ncbi:MAG TPA: hypothetical protein VM737_03875 [Gemmatimonadota bacterium]|nr:hypothetical protein [Gemmatimonadota bacterium]
MRRWKVSPYSAPALVLFLALACQAEPPDESGGPAEGSPAAGGAATGAETGAPAPGEAAGGAATTGGGATTASTVEGTGAPSPPGGYAVDSRPAGDGRLAVIEYASPSTVPEVGAFYDGRVQAVRRVEVEVPGDNLLVYALSARTSVRPAITALDVRRLLEERNEPLVVVAPWTMQRADPLIRDLREAGLSAQADALLNTRSKITVVYAVR